MKILITGGNGFISRNIKPILEKQGNYVENPSRQELDVYDSVNVNYFFQKNNYDIVIHTAIKGGRRTIVDTEEIVEYNMKMFFNLVEQLKKGSIKKIINLGSGAAFDRRNNIYNYDETFLGRTIPEDYYGLSKYKLEEFILNTDLDIINIRIFGCFGFDESKDRFIHSCLKSVLTKTEINIFNDRYMDFIFVEDLGHLINNIISSELKIKDINACYTQKYKLSEIANMILNMFNSKVCINCGDTINSYCGKSMLEELNLIKNFKGLENGIKLFYEFISKT